jgi:hypothetical protein
LLVTILLLWLSLIFGATGGYASNLVAIAEYLCPGFDNMSQTVLLAFRDDMQLRSRSVTLKYAGYRTACANNLSRAIALSFDMTPNLIVLGDSFSDDEQAAFVDELHECQPGIWVLCLKSGVEPASLVEQCRSILTGEPASAKVRLLQAS